MVGGSIGLIADTHLRALSRTEVMDRGDVLMSGLTRGSDSVCYGYSRSLPLVVRDSMSRWAWAASLSG